MPEPYNPRIKERIFVYLRYVDKDTVICTTIWI